MRSVELLLNSSGSFFWGGSGIVDGYLREICLFNSSWFKHFLFER